MSNYHCAAEKHNNKKALQHNTNQKKHTPQAQACLALNLSMRFASLATPSTGMALYNDARHPPTERWPARFVSPSVFASARNCFVKSASSPLITNGTFMRDRHSLSTGHEKKPLLLSMVS